MEALAGFFRQFPALLITLGAFALILVLARLKAPLVAAIFAGAIVIAFSFGRGAGEVAGIIGQGAIMPNTLGLLIITMMQLVLSGLMQAGGQMERIVHLARLFFRRPAAAMAALPALIGLLPMPGGAVFSAPMVQAAAGSDCVNGGKLSAINYWFRHVWEHWWPLYPGVITAIALTGVSPYRFVMWQLPLGIFMASSGLLVLRGMHADVHRTGGSPPAGTKRQLLKATSSIWVIILLAIPAGVVMNAMTASAPPGAVHASAAAGNSDLLVKALNRFGPIGLGLVAAIFWTIGMNRLGRKELLRVARAKGVYAMGLLVVSVMVFQHVLSVVEAPQRIAQELQTSGIPLISVVVALPFIAGMVTGLAIGFVGTSFPIVLPLIVQLADGGTILPYVALAYAFGHMGQMLSPIHLCYVVSNQYFKTPFSPVYRQIIPPAIMTALLTVGYFIVTRLLTR